MQAGLVLMIEKGTDDDSDQKHDKVMTARLWQGLRLHLFALYGKDQCVVETIGTDRDGGCASSGLAKG